MKNNEVALLKSMSVKLSNGKTMIVMMNYHTETDPATGKQNRGKAFYRCDAKVLKDDDWKKLAADLGAEPVKDQDFKLKDIGLDLGEDYGVFYAKKGMVKKNASRFIELKLAKAVDFDTWRGKAFEGKEPFLKLYGVGQDQTVDLSNLTAVEGLTTGVWVGAVKTRVRKPKAVVAAPATQAAQVQA